MLMFTILMVVQILTLQLRLVTVLYFMVLNYGLIIRIVFASELSGSYVVNMNFYMLMYILEKMSFTNCHPKLTDSFELMCQDSVCVVQCGSLALYFKYESYKEMLEGIGQCIKIKLYIKPQEKFIEFLLKYPKKVV